MEWSVVSAVNDDSVLRNCLLRSPDLQAGVSLFIEKGQSSAAAAYNAAIEKVDTDLVMFVHQDIYLPAGWLAQLERALELLEAKDPNWGVVGVWGVNQSGTFAGYLFWTGIGKPRGEIFEGGIEVQTLDEVILIFRKSSGLRFDPQLPGFHMYGPDICLQAQSRGKKSYAISALCIHNTRIPNLLPWQFWKCYWFMRRKWKAQLPIHTSCTVITRGCWPVIKWNAVMVANLLLGRGQTFKREEDPTRVYDQLRAGNVPAIAAEARSAKASG